MFFLRPAHKNRRDHFVDGGDGKRLRPRGYWHWSKFSNDYYHRNKDGSYIWASTFNTEMDDARRYAELSRQAIADSAGIARGVGVAFSKAPGSLGLLNRRILPGSSTCLPSFTSPKVAPDYKISFSPTSHHSAPGARLAYVRNPYEAGRHRISLRRTTDSDNAKPAGGRPISGVSLSKERGIIAPSIGNIAREVSLSTGSKLTFSPKSSITKTSNSGQRYSPDLTHQSRSTRCKPSHQGL